MSTTTIRLEEQLKERVAAAAAQAGKTAHAFILDAIAQAVEQVEADNALRHTAQARWDKCWPAARQCPGRKRGPVCLPVPAANAFASPRPGRRTPDRRFAMARIHLAPEDFEDFDRTFDHIAQCEPESAPERIAAIAEAIQVLASSPLPGRPAAGRSRELVIECASRGYLAL